MVLVVEVEDLSSSHHLIIGTMVLMVVMVLLELYGVLVDYSHQQILETYNVRTTAIFIYTWNSNVRNF